MAHKAPRGPASGLPVPSASWLSAPWYRSLEGALGAAWRESARAGVTFVVSLDDAGHYVLSNAASAPASRLVASVRAGAVLETNAAE